MNTQYASHLELFFKLIDVRIVSIGECVPFSVDQNYQSLIECIRQRTRLTTWCVHPCTEEDMDINDWRPEWFYGLPQRVFLLKQQLFISATMPESSDARYWYKQYKKQQIFLQHKIEGLAWR